MPAKQIEGLSPGLLSSATASLMGRVNQEGLTGINPTAAEDPNCTRQ